MEFNLDSNLQGHVRALLEVAVRGFPPAASAHQRQVQARRVTALWLETMDATTSCFTSEELSTFSVKFIRSRTKQVTVVIAT